MEDILTQHEIGKQLRTSGRSIGRWYASAFVGRTEGTAIKLYSLKAVVAEISNRAGHPLEPKHIPDLITLPEAEQILIDAGVRRSEQIWRRWARAQVGPAQYKVGGNLRYLEPDVRSWAQYLKNCPRRYVVELSA